MAHSQVDVCTVYPSENHGADRLLEIGNLVVARRQ
jgi:hypothetical protein